MPSGYVVVCYVITTYVLFHVIQVLIVLIVWSSIIVVGVRIILRMALESVLKEHYRVSNVFFTRTRTSHYIYRLFIWQCRSIAQGIHII